MTDTTSIFHIQIKSHSGDTWDWIAVPVEDATAVHKLLGTPNDTTLAGRRRNHAGIPLDE